MNLRQLLDLILGAAASNLAPEAATFAANGIKKAGLTDAELAVVKTFAADLSAAL